MNAGNVALLQNQLRRMAVETAQLPGFRVLAKPLYRWLFQRPEAFLHYYGVYDSFQQAIDHAPPSLPTSFDIRAAGQMFRRQLERIRVSDYPTMFWLSKLLAQGQRRLFDLGGHIGLTYYGYRRYLDYPANLHWLVHDMPAVVSAGREWAIQHDPAGRLQFTGSREDADGCDVLLTSGTLQYLDYTLAEFLQCLSDRPQHVLINMVPMHPSRGYFTLQNIGIAICPYRVSAVGEFVAAMEHLGYQVVDRWESLERHLHIPFAAQCDIDRYYGFYFRRTPDQGQPR